MSLFSDVFSLPEHFEFFAIFFSYLHFAKFVCLFKRLQSETGMAEKYSWDQTNAWQIQGLVWRIKEN
jgi:hypothetical protein